MPKLELWQLFNAFYFVEVCGGAWRCRGPFACRDRIYLSQGQLGWVLNVQLRCLWQMISLNQVESEAKQPS